MQKEEQFINKYCKEYGFVLKRHKENYTQIQAWKKNDDDDD